MQIAVASVLLSVFGTSYAASISMAPAGSNVVIGDQVAIDIFVNFDDDPTLGGGIDILFDQTHLNVLDVVQASVGDPGFTSLGGIANPGGRVASLAFGDFNCVGGGGDILIATILFEVVGAFSSTDIVMQDNADAAGPFFSCSTFSQQTVDFSGATLSQAGADTDSDGIPDSSDNCPSVFNTDQADNDSDDIGDVCDDDDDNDTVLDDVDNCPIDANEDQADNDGDQLGDVCDPDDDNDGILDGDDNCPIDANQDQANNDGDGLGDVCDPDDDNDGVLDGADNCPIDANPNQEDSDSDLIGDVCDPDDDNDTVLDDDDLCPSTAIPDGAPSRRLGKNRWTFVGNDGANFTQASPQAGSVFQFTTGDTGGCSCEQIVAATGTGKDHLRKGCSTSVMLNWVGSL
jgi:hypothetical protein